MASDPASLASLSLTHVYYNPDDPVSYVCAWLALLPQALCVVYATLVWSTREAEVALAFAGQLGCEAVNFALKRLIKEERPRHHHWYGFSSSTDTTSPPGEAGAHALHVPPPFRRGYGMPSSHAQFAGYWAVTIALFLLVRYRGTASERATSKRTTSERATSERATSNARTQTSEARIEKTDWPLEQRVAISVGALVIAVLIAWSRVYLHYHTERQVLAGFAAGVVVALGWFVATEVVRQIGLLQWALALPPARWLRIRDLAAEEDAAQAGWEKWLQREAAAEAAKRR